MIGRTGVKARLWPKQEEDGQPRRSEGGRGGRLPARGRGHRARPPWAPTGPPALTHSVAVGPATLASSPPLPPIPPCSEGPWTKSVLLFPQDPCRYGPQDHTLSCSGWTCTCAHKCAGWTCVGCNRSATHSYTVCERVCSSRSPSSTTSIVYTPIDFSKTHTHTRVLPGVTTHLETCTLKRMHTHKDVTDTHVVQRTHTQTPLCTQNQYNRVVYHFRTRKD